MSNILHKTTTKLILLEIIRLSNLPVLAYSKDGNKGLNDYEKNALNK